MIHRSPNSQHHHSGSGEPTHALDELSQLLDRLENRVETARRMHWDGLVQAANPSAWRLQQSQQKQPPPPSGTVAAPPARTGLGRFLSRRRSGDAVPAITPSPAPAAAAAVAPPPRPTTPPPADTDPSPSPSLKPHGVAGNKNNNHNHNRTKPVADFITFPDEDAFVEDLRRAAELCVIGENFVTNLQKRQDRQKERDTQRWRAARDGLIGEDDFDIASSENANELLDDDGDLDQTDEKTQLFDLFFERMGLALIVDLLSGDTLNFAKNPVYKKNEEELNQSNNSLKEPELDGKTLLPPLTIATQALQSISIMIQNVSRATSLYVILSNNYVNKLIELPLNLYTIAERRRIMNTKEAKSLPSTFASPQITELATHFVTFLKSLAMRMNAETLQFYLKYPSDFPSEQVDDDENGSAPEVLDDIPTVQFALYDRALEFCAAHHDSFVRTTALNIALNVLRLTTLVPPDNEVEELEKSAASSTRSHSSNNAMGAASPDGVLHNAKPLPFRERLAVAQFACIPSRVEHLISPIFVKIAERWSALDEAIRSIDINKHIGGEAETTDDGTARNERVALAKEKVRRERLIRTFKGKVAELEDELLLLDDVFRVGLTVLNEQMIEMMLATLVYPLLLQPLLLYYQHLTTAIDEDRFSLTDHPFGGIGADLSEVDKSLLQVSTPAKSALFTLSLVFKFVSNRPLLRLLHTVLFHPLSPDSNSAPTVRSRLEVATVDRNGRNRIRLDEVNFPRDELIPNERTTYAFGTVLTNRRTSSRTIDPDDPRKSEACVFVLAPALAEVLEYRGQDMALVARARPNPYRRALLKCLTVPEDMSDVRQLTICTFNCALSNFDGGFNAAILFGMDLRTFTDDIPADERTLDSAYAHAEDNRGIGRSAQLDSRRSAGPSKGGSVGVDPVAEVVSALCSCVVHCSRLPSNEWKLGYDEVAAHTLLTAIRCHPGAIHAAAKLMENKWRQAACLLADVPLGLNPMGGSPFTLPGAPSINDPAYERLIFEAFLNIVFYDPLDLGGTPVTQELFQPPETDEAESNEPVRYIVAVSLDCDLKELFSRVGRFLLEVALDTGPLSYDQEMVYDRRDGARCWFKIDSFLTLLNSLAATAGLSLRDAPLSGIAFDPDGSVVKLNEEFDKRSIYSNISPDAQHTFFSKHSDNEQPESQSFVDLVGGPAIPCVIEAAEAFAYLFSDEASGIIAEGVTWQSLYLVVIGHFLVFAVPLPDGTGTVGRVITACNLERITLEFDTLEPEDGSSARRIGLNHRWFDKDPPPLFLFDELPNYEEYGPFVRVTPFTSRLDVWFENERAASYGYGELCSQIFKAKAHRGRWLRSFLDPQGEHDESPW